MKRISLLAALFLLLSPYAFTQQAPGQVEEKIEAQRVAFITTRLDLTPQEAQNFWPVYNEYKAEEKALKRSIRRPGKLATASDSEIERYLDQALEVEAKQLDLKRKYFQDLKSVLSVRKIAQLIMAERAFTQMVIKRMNERSGNRRKRN